MSMAASGPVASDFVDIRTVRPNLIQPRRTAKASTGIFTSRCGRNQEGQHNSDNVIVNPGVHNGAHHTHDYVGNVSTNGFSTNDSLAAAGTTCTNGDKSTYYWPVLRVQWVAGPDANAAGGGLDGNIGQILTPTTVSLQYGGSATGPVTAMPRFLRIISGDAKAVTNGTANAHAQWTCTGFENRRLTDKYPICPQGSKVERILQMQSCWNGRDIDSTNHRTHVAFPNASGTCPAGFKAIPALTERLTYTVPRGARIALDSFPDQLHKPVTDHGDFINVMSDALMRQAVACINTGRRCG